MRTYSDVTIGLETCVAKGDIFEEEIEIGNHICKKKNPNKQKPQWFASKEKKTNRENKHIIWKETTEQMHTQTTAEMCGPHVFSPKPAHHPNPRVG